MSPIGPIKPQPPKRNPVIKFSAKCPICEATSEQYGLNPRLFWHKDLDIDQQPRNYQSVAGLEIYHPPLFYMWFCPFCRFTAGHKYYSEPMKGIFIGMDLVRAKVKEAAAGDARFKQLVALLGDQIDTRNPDFFMAIKLHLLAIVFLDVIEKMVKQNFVNLGRYYLRLAWLHRDLSQRPDDRDKTQPLLAALDLKLKPLWPDYPVNEREALLKAVERYNATFEASAAVRSPVDEIKLMQIIARLHYKLTDYREAQEMLMTSASRALAAKLEIDQRLKAGNRDGTRLNAEESGELVTQSRKLEKLIEDAQDLIQSIRETAKQKSP